MGIGSTLQNLLEKNNRNVNEVAVATGVSPSTLYSIIKRDSMSANIEDLYKVAHYLGVSLDYFYSKKDFGDTMELFSAEEKDFMRKFRQLDTYSRQTLQLLLQREYSRTQNTDLSITPPKTICLRLSEQPASAGKGIYLGPEAFRDILVIDTPKTQRASFAVRVSGDSMEPAYQDGDIILVAAEAVEQDDIAVVTLNGEGYVKRIGADELVSLNPQYPPIPLNDSVRVNGLVIGKLLPSQIVDQ